MAIDLSENGQGYSDLKKHIGHKISVVSYGNGENIAIECDDCNTILVVFKKPNMFSSMFEIGDQVEVLANNDDVFNDFIGTVVNIKEEGIISVKDQDDDVWDVGENQCYLD
jgi:transcription antitermination factor NusG